MMDAVYGLATLLGTQTAVGSHTLATKLNAELSAFKTRRERHTVLSHPGRCLRDGSLNCGSRECVIT